MGEQRGIPTTYKGITYRSTAEARYARYFDLKGWRVAYEPVDLKGYVPDFWVWDRGDSDKPLLWEVKGGEVEINALYQHTEKLNQSGWEKKARRAVISLAEPYFGEFRSMDEDDSIGSSFDDEYGPSYEEMYMDTVVEKVATGRVFEMPEKGCTRELLLENKEKGPLRRLEEFTTDERTFLQRGCGEMNFVAAGLTDVLFEYKLVPKQVQRTRVVKRKERREGEILFHWGVSRSAVRNSEWKPIPSGYSSIWTVANVQAMWKQVVDEVGYARGGPKHAAAKQRRRRHPEAY
jgi:hypothetical protein